MLRIRHHVRCPSCAERFDLFAAEWCGDARRSKRCPHCGRCACADPDYGEPRLWKDAPPVFRKHGFRRLFVRYL